MNGPLPTGFLLNSLLVRSSFASRCFGTIPLEPPCPRNIGVSRLSVTLTVRGSGASTLAIVSSPSVEERVSGLTAASKVNLTSSA